MPSDPSNPAALWVMPSQMRDLAAHAQSRILAPARQEVSRIAARLKQKTAEAERSRDQAVAAINDKLQKKTAEVEQILQALRLEISRLHSSAESALTHARSRLQAENLTSGTETGSGLPSNAPPGMGRSGQSAHRYLTQAGESLARAQGVSSEVMDKINRPRSMVWLDNQEKGCVFTFGLILAAIIGAAAGRFGGLIFAVAGVYTLVMVFRALLPINSLRKAYAEITGHVALAQGLIAQAAAAAETEARIPREAAKAEARQPLAAAEAEAARALDQFGEESRAALDALERKLREQLDIHLAACALAATQTGLAGADWADDSLWAGWQPSEDPDFGARFGQLESATADLAEVFPALPLPVRLPALMPFADGRGLLVEAPDSHREAAAGAIQSLLSRLLATIPPGKVRMTFFDPVGLGNHVAAFMPLADYEESLINSRAWSEPSHIEQRLADITEHMETVIQKYLRTEYRTIHDYNAAAGEVAEPFRVVVAFDFPVNFTDSAARRLVSIARNGARCGVYVIVVCDPHKTLYGFNLAELEQTCDFLRPTEPARKDFPAGRAAVVHEARLDGRVALIEAHREAWGSSVAQAKSAVESALAEPDPEAAVNALFDGAPESPASTPAGAASPHSTARFRWQADPFEGWTVAPDAAPPDHVLRPIIKRIGGKAKDAMRVEVPFDKLLTMAEITADTWWQASTAGSVRVPLGPSGARRLQYLTLGEGLGHHALIVGRPGSGKSNLMHVIITTLALVYPPEEIQFYLIDFKKGVEFKTYAEHKLPHALAIAVESEREFGFSVIQRLDVELKERGDRFRAAGAANIKEFRQKTGEQIPRVLLLIDEFQELFTENDQITSQSALLLDRLVRQGRAFGLHVLLGSQTLAGSFNLSKSTLDQMAIRIAMQCSESDSRLILADDNPAARLLSRPGEAIYNASSGLVEGNNLFQAAVFKEDTDHARALETISELARRRGGPIPEPLVFEGGELAHTEGCRALRALLDAPDWPRATNAVDVFLGEPIAIRPPVAARLRRQSGHNLLLVARDEAEGVGMCVAALVSIFAQKRPEAARVLIADFTTAESDWTEHASGIARDFPGEVTVVKRQRDVGGMFAQVQAELRSRAEEETSGGSGSVFVVLQGMHRIKALREDEEDDDGINAVEVLGGILQNGPEVGVHVIAWVDTWTNATRGLSRKAMREFGLRVGTAMNADESLSLLDDAAASRLSRPHRAIFFDEEKPGQLVTFRPYSLAPAAWLAETGGTLRARLQA